MVEEVADEGFLQALGIHRVAVPIPFIEAGGPVNVYFLADLPSALASIAKSA